jgi:hypothetical protein
MVDWCLFGLFANEKNTTLTDTFNNRPCNAQCSKIYDPAGYDTYNNPESYSFCDYKGNFTTDSDPCLECLYKTPEMTILGNGEFAMEHPQQFLMSFANVWRYSACDNCGYVQAKTRPHLQLP